MKKVGLRGKRNIIGCCAAVLTAAFFLAGCGQKVETSSIFAMDTIMELQVQGDEELLRSSEAKIRELEHLLSVTDENSDIYRLNRGGSCQISDTTAQIMEKALGVCDRTEGALDISIYPVLKCWGFTTGENKVPTAQELESHLASVDYRKVKFSGDTGAVTASIEEGMEIDLGSIVKGYTGTMIADYYRENGVKSALINLGGNVQCVGKKPNGEPWKVAIKSPFSDTQSGIYGVLSAEDEAIITSGGYERYFEENGEIYWHILDPTTGYPAKSGLLSVTIVGRDGLVCDGLSTALFVKGLESAIDIWKKSDDFEAIFITEEGDVYITEGIAKDFSLSSEYYNAEIHVVAR